MPIAIMPDEHCRSTVIPGTCTGMPAASALQRPTLYPVVPWGSAQPRITSCTSPASTSARSRAWVMAWAARVGPSVLLKAPR